jgi:hypothetical protein
MPKRKEKERVTTVAIEEPEDMSKFVTKVDKLPETARRHGEGKYKKIVNWIAKQKAGNYEIKLSEIAKDMKLKSVYPSFEKVLQGIAELNGVDMKKITEETIQTKKGARKYTHHPLYDEWKKKTMRLRVAGNKLYIIKLTDKPLETL